MKRSIFIALAIALAGSIAATSRAQDPGLPGGPADPKSPKAPATPSAPESKLPPDGTTRFIVGGDSRDDHSHVLPWAFKEAKDRGAKAFIFLGDMELTPELDARFKSDLKQLQPIPFYPVLGNHEVDQFGVFRLGFIEKLIGYNPEKKFRKRFLGTKETPVTSSFSDEVVYAVDLDGGIHFVALDNVSQKGFGKKQLAWLENDLKTAKAQTPPPRIVVGMHKALAKNGVTTHAMDEDGSGAIADSDAALAMFQKYGVAMIFASHSHMYAKLVQGGIESHITGGLGAPLVNGAGGFHHMLVLDSSANGLAVTMVKFDGSQTMSKSKDDD